MTAKEFIQNNYPITAKELEEGRCVGLNDIAYLFEEYHKYKINKFKFCPFCGWKKEPKNNSDITTALVCRNSLCK